MAYILVVDDSVDGRDALTEFLRRAGHEVASSSNGREALTSILTRTPDLVVLDLFMPEMDGPSLLEVLRSYLRLQSLPVVVLTGLPDSPMVERTRHLQINAILVKGQATLQEILQTVNQELHRLPTH